MGLREPCPLRGKKMISSEAIRGMKLKHFNNVHSINFYNHIVFIAVVYVLWLLWQLKLFIAL